VLRRRGCGCCGGGTEGPDKKLKAFDTAGLGVTSAERNPPRGAEIGTSFISFVLSVEAVSSEKVEEAEEECMTLVSTAEDEACNERVDGVMIREIVVGALEECLKPPNLSSSSM
jgi:hypothetical protein